MSNKRLSDESIQKIKELFIEGYKIADICVRVGASYKTVSKYIHELGLVRQLWSDEEIEILKNNIHLSYQKISEMLGGVKNKEQVRWCIEKMGLRKGVQVANQRKFLTIRELEAFKKDYPTHRNKDLCIKYGISISQVKNQAKRHNLVKHKKIRNGKYTESDFEYIKSNYGKMRISEIAERLGYSKDAIKSFIYRNKSKIIS